MSGTPLHTWDDEIREELSRLALRDGWSRTLPSSGLLMLLTITMADEPSTIDDIRARLRTPTNPDGEWDVPCWEPIVYFTDESLAELNAEYGDEDDDGRSAAQVNADEEAHREKQVAQLDACAAPYGLSPVRTCPGLLDLLIAAGVVHRREDGLICPVYPMPRPDDVFPLPDEELAALAEMREHNRAEDAGRALHGYLDGDLRKTGEVFTTIERLMDATGAKAETVRLGLAELGKIGYARIIRSRPAVDTDPACLELHARFRIVRSPGG